MDNRLLRHIKDAELMNIETTFGAKNSMCDNVCMFALPKVTGVLRDVLYLDCTPVLVLVYNPRWTESSLLSAVYFSYGEGCGISLNPHVMMGHVGFDAASGLSGRLCGGENPVSGAESYDLEEIVGRAILSSSSCTRDYADNKTPKGHNCLICGSQVYYRYTRNGWALDNLCIKCLTKVIPRGMMLSPEYIYSIEAIEPTINGQVARGVCAYRTPKKDIYPDPLSFVVGEMKILDVYQDGYDPDRDYDEEYYDEEDYEEEDEYDES